MKIAPSRLRLTVASAVVTTALAVALSPGVAVAAPGTVAADDAPPTIVSQPRATSATLLLDARFAVKATGENLTYQWQRRIGSTWVVIDKPSMPSMWLKRVAIPDDNVAFRVRVSNSAGTVVSRPALLDVTPASTTLTISVNRTEHEKGAPTNERGVVTMSVVANNGMPLEGYFALYDGSQQIGGSTRQTDGQTRIRVPAKVGVGVHQLSARWRPSFADWTYNEWVSGSTSNAITYTVS